MKNIQQRFFRNFFPSFVYTIQIPGGSSELISLKSRLCAAGMKILNECEGSFHGKINVNKLFFTIFFIWNATVTAQVREEDIVVEVERVTERNIDAAFFLFFSVFILIGSAISIFNGIILKGLVALIMPAFPYFIAFIHSRFVTHSGFRKLNEIIRNKKFQKQFGLDEMKQALRNMDE